MRQAEAPAILLSSLLFALLVGHSAADNYLFHFCMDRGNFTSNSAYKQNLDLLLSQLSTAAASDSFYNVTAGQIPDKVYSLFMCRGDVNLNVCHACVQAASEDLVKRCPYQKEAIIWHDQCMLRYSNRSIFSTLDSDSSGSAYLTSISNVSDVSQLDEALNKTFPALIARAAFDPSSSKMFATGEAAFGPLRTVYCLAQCTPDISRADCSFCLKTATTYLTKNCHGRETGDQLWSNCILRYSIYPFYQSLPPPPPSTNTTVTNTTTAAAADNKPNSSPVAIIIAIPTATTLIVLSSLCFYVYRRRRRSNSSKMMRIPEQDVDDADEIISAEYLQIDFDVIRAATDNFSYANKIGQGGFGIVYKGTFSNGQNVAVKRLSKIFGQGEVEFKNEVLLVAKLQHRNLVKLLGFCLEGEERLLIYEFVQNGSLDNFIFDPTKRIQLDWNTRYKIIREIARGLLYLHEDSRIRIVHRDLKASNILLDGEMNPKISDFGMARLFVVDQTQGLTNRIVGTFGYMAPEYAMHGQFSVKSDVFSFGVLLLEIVSGQKNSYSNHSENLLSRAWRCWNESASLEFTDPTLTKNYSKVEVLRCIHIGLLCIQENIADRPTMASVVQALNNNSGLPIPSAPAFVIPGKMEASLSSKENYYPTPAESDQSTSNVSTTKICPR